MRVTGFQSADPPLLLRRVDNENVALALAGVIKGDSFSVGRPFGRSVATARVGALPNTAAPSAFGRGLNIGYLFGLSPTRYARWFNGYIGTSANQTAREEKRASRDSLQRSQQALLSSGMNPNDRLFASNQYAFSSTKIAIVALCLLARLGGGAGHNGFRRRVRQRSLIR